MEATYFQQYFLIAVLLISAIGMGVLPLVLARIISPKKPGKSKQDAYECGMESSGDPWVQMNVQYYLYALLFVIFDIEVVFIYPWALVWRQLGPIALVEMGLFIGILAVVLIYAWKKGVLEWD